MTTARVPAGVAGGLLALSLALAGCGDATTAPAGSAPAAPAPSAAPPAGTQFNEADVAFARMMVPHHREAVEMAELAAGRAGNPEVTALAGQIRAAQEPEIAQLTGLLDAWGAEAPAAHSASGAHHGDTSGAPTMPGAMTPEQMQQLRGATGAEFDRMFLTMMIEHHRGAVAMAQAQIAQGSDLDATRLAEKIVAEQNAEISRMQQLQAG